MKKIVFCLLFCFIFILTACSSGNDLPGSSSPEQSLNGSSLEQSSQKNSSNAGSNLIESNTDSSLSYNNGISSSDSVVFPSSNSLPVSSSSTKVDIPSAIENVIDTAINETILSVDGKIDRDFVIFPRVSAKNLVYITWESQNQNVIDNYGNVKQGSSIQSVNITGCFSYGNYSKTAVWTVNVLPKRAEYETITKNDPRILRTVPVTDCNTLTSALSNAQAGDCILLKDGTYSNFSYEVKKSGTSTNPIFIIAENSQRAIFSGSTYIEISGNNVILAGLKFVNGEPKENRGFISIEGDDCRVTNCLADGFFKASVEAKWLSLYGKRTEVDHNEFIGKQSAGALLTVWRNDSSAQYHHIHHNLFKDFPEGNDNGFETIRIGDSAQSQSDAYCLVENNVFSACNGEIEIISVKSGRNIIRNNTFIESKGHLTFRHGKNNYAGGNVFLCNGASGSGGVRAYDGGHIIVNNYVYKQLSTSNTRAAFIAHSGQNVVGEIPALNAGWTAYNCLFENNTAIDCQQSFLFCESYDYGSKDVVLKNNVFANSTCAGIRVNIEPVNLISENNLVYSPKLYSSKTSYSQLTGLIQKNYSLPTPTKNGYYEFAGAGATNVVSLNESQVGNY